MIRMSGKSINRLTQEKSPYLRQHAHNPVSWFPWREEAFEEAARLDRPIFLSIGYSTCHWCHVMEKESFADEEIARLMNETFVSIKVDREERPDIDAHYMAVCQLLTGSGGWPLTVILTPDKKPFFAGTYFPKESRFGLIGLKDLIGRIADAWQHRRSELLSSAERIRTALEAKPESPSPEMISLELLDRAEAELSRQFDAEFGGFGQGPKFPSPHHLYFLLCQAKRKNDKRPLAMAELTLQAMRRGGLYDHIGFGFHRYSTDRRWVLPHFEKMLYDQALLAIAYVEAFEFTHRPEYQQTVEEILSYVGRDLRSPAGAYFTAEDADSEGEEGNYYLWELRELESALSPSEAKLAKELFHLSPEGNFWNSEGRRSGKNVLRLDWPPEPTGHSGTPQDKFQKKVASIRRKLFIRREMRARPLKDTKILTDWNGLMIAALAKAARALDRPDYAAAAAQAADFIRDRMTVKERLYHCFADGEAAIPGFLDDYAFLIWGLIELYPATFEPRFLSWAAMLCEVVIRDFSDEKNGRFFFVSTDLHTDSPSKRKELYDGALPSGNSVMAANLLRLGRILGRPDLEARAVKLIEAFSSQVFQYPTGYTHFLSALSFALGQNREVVIVARRGAPDTRALLDVLRREFLPDSVVLFRPAEETSPEIATLAPFTAEMKALNGQATAYVCSNYRCGRPTTDPDELRSLLLGTCSR